jgi:hypothetical protein
MKRIYSRKRPDHDGLMECNMKGALGNSVAILIFVVVIGSSLFKLSTTTCPADIERSRAALADSYAALQSVIETGPRSKCVAYQNHLDALTTSVSIIKRCGPRQEDNSVAELAFWRTFVAEQCG